MTQRDDDLIELRRALADRAINLVSDVLGEPNRALSSRLVKRWGKKGSFKLNLTGDLRGRYYDYEAQSGGDMLSFIQDNHTGSNFVDALKWARHYLGWPVDGPAPQPTRKADIRRKELEEARARREAAAEQDLIRRRIQARQIWNETVAINDTLGERYLTQTRAIPYCDWPASIRWHEGEQAVTVSVTNNAGEIVAVQRIAVTPEAKKDEQHVWPISGGGQSVQPKNSRGPVNEGAVKLPGKSDGPICFAEGPETGLSIWTATGFETWIVLGGLRRVSNIAPHNRRIIICCDNSRDGSNTHKGAKAAYAELLSAGVDVRYAYPHEIKRQDTSDFNDVLIADGINAVRDRIYLANLDAPSYAPLRFNVDDARKIFNKRAAEFFIAAEQWQNDTPAPTHVIGLGLGGGKTRAAIEEAVQLSIRLRNKNDSRAIAIMVPEHRLSQEVADRARQYITDAGAQLNVAVWRGREAKINPHDNSEDAQRMCAEWETVREAEAVWADIDTEVCKVCPHFETCGYLGQKKLEADIWVVAHHMTAKEAPTTIKRNGIAAIIVDESPIKATIRTRTEIPLDLLEYGAMALSHIKNEAYDLADYRLRVLNSLTSEPDGWVRREAFAKETSSVTSKDVNSAIALEWKRKVKRQQVRNWRERDANKTLGKAHMMWSAIDKLVGDDGPEASGHLSLHRNNDGVRILTVTGRADIHTDWQVPTLLIDARHSPDLIKHFWPLAEDKGQIPINAPYQKIRQYTGRSYALGYLAPSEDAKRDKANRKHRRTVKAFICRRARELGGKTLVVGNKEVIQAMKLPRHIETAWFGAVAGRDTWGDVRLLVVVGRPQPKPSEVEWQAAAITGVAVQRISDGKEHDPTKTWYPKTDTFRFKNEGGEVIRIPAQADCHPDALCERLREETCTGQIVQAIGRARGVNRKAVSDPGSYNGPVEVIVLTDAVLPNTMPVDEFLTDEDMAVSPADMMLAEGGVAFEDGASAAMAYPDLWASPGAYREAMRRQRRVTKSYNEVLVGECPHDGLGAISVTKSYKDTLIGECDAVRFQRQGPKLRFETAYYDPRMVDEPRSALLRLVGPLAAFEDFGAPDVAEPLPIAVGDPEGQQSGTYSSHAIAPSVAKSGGRAVVLSVAIGERADAVDAIIVAQETSAEAIAEPEPEPPDGEEVVIPASIWVAVWNHARDCELGHGDVAADWCSMSACHLSNIQAGRRKATPELLAALNRFLAEAKPTQPRLF